MKLKHGVRSPRWTQVGLSPPTRRLVNMMNLQSDYEGTAFDVGKPRERPPGGSVDSILGRSKSTGLPVVNESSKRTENGRLGRGWVSAVGKKT